MDETRIQGATDAVAVTEELRCVDVTFEPLEFFEGDRCLLCHHWWWDDHGVNGGEGWHSLVPIIYAGREDSAHWVTCSKCIASATSTFGALPKGISRG